MKAFLALSINSFLIVSGSSVNSGRVALSKTAVGTVPVVVAAPKTSDGVSASHPPAVVDKKAPQAVAIPLISKTEGNVPEFVTDLPATLLHLEQTGPLRFSVAGPKVFDGTEYGESVERLVPQGPRAKHFLRQSESPRTLEKDRRSVQSSLDVDESAAADEFGIEEGVKYVVSAIETLPTHPAVEEAVKHVDNWAQEAKAGFLGYWERLSSLWKKESKNVGNKLFEAADAYSHRFFTLLHVKESDHPVLAAKITRIILAMGLSLTLVFLIFGLALQLQKSIVARAHEEAGKQQPRIVQGEQLFFAMPYPQAQSGNDNIVVVE